MPQNYNHYEILQNRTHFLTQNATDLAVRTEILNSWKRSKSSNLYPDKTELPPLNSKDIARAKSNVTGYTKHIRKSTPEYYNQLQNILSAIGACLCYVTNDLYIYGRYGNRDLKNELKSINIALGTNLSESRIGTNAAALTSISQEETWVIGAEHYLKAFHNYACFAFPVHASYNRNFFIMLITRLENLNSLITQCFQFIKSTELIISSGLATSDMIIKNQLTDFNMEKNESILIVVDNSGVIINVNSLFFKVFHIDFTDVIGKQLSGILPELEFTLSCFEIGHYISMQEISFQKLPPNDNMYFISCTPMKRNEKWLGMVITLEKSQKIKTMVHKIANLNAHFTFDDLIGTSAKFTHIKSLAQKAAHSPSNVLILGESGTGKELFAHSIHNESSRRNKPFISVNCAAIPRELIGSELFGYVQGAFTGAKKDGAQGKFELANEGTLFLDELAEMPLDMQSILLRVLEDKTITRLGGSKPISVDVRLIAATNKNLRTLVDEGKFRLDLYYRLNVIKLELVPLRERPEDIPIMVKFFLSNFSQSFQKQVMSISDEALRILQSYAWPGNIRELRNIIEQGVNISSSNQLTISDLPTEIIAFANPKTTFAKKFNTEEKSLQSQLDKDYDICKKDLIKKLMKKHKGNKSLVAAELGIARTTLYRQLKDM